MSPLLTVGTFLVEHETLLVEIMNAVENGLDEAALLKMVKDAMVAASDAEMKAELG